MTRALPSLTLSTLVLTGVSAGGCRSADAVTSDAGPAALASTDLAPAKKPPALRVARAPTPPLPDLPLLAEHETPAKLPFGLSRSLFGKCLGVWNGSELSATGCARSALLFGRDGNGAEPIVPAGRLAAEAGTLPSVVDHRLERTEGPIRNQGRAPACTAFAMAAALDHAVARWKGDALRVSVTELWARYHSPFEAKSVQANLGQTLASEDVWPFDATESIAMLGCDDGGPPGKCGLLPSPQRMARAVAAPIASFTHVEYLEETDLASLERKLAAGQDIIVSIDLPEAFVPKGKAGARYVPHYTDVPPDSGHALVLAGYAALPHATYFLLHNSWGPAWGDAGYAWIHEATLRAHLKEALVVDAEPADARAADRARPKRQRGETTCTGALVPDSIQGACSPRCPDGGPRHDGVCAALGQCPRGYVNLTGECVLAAPTATGEDRDVAWRCSAEGCAYVVAKKLDPVCTGATCMVSCPAPDFRLARAPAQGARLTCVE
jgi:hypothetical protein